MLESLSRRSGLSTNYRNTAFGLLEAGTRAADVPRNFGCNERLSTALAKHHANGDTSMVTEIVNLCPIM